LPIARILGRQRLTIGEKLRHVERAKRLGENEGYMERTSALADAMTTQAPAATDAAIRAEVRICLRATH